MIVFWCLVFRSVEEFAVPFLSKSRKRFIALKDHKETFNRIYFLQFFISCLTNSFMMLNKKIFLHLKVKRWTKVEINILPHCSSFLFFLNVKVTDKGHIAVITVAEQLGETIMPLCKQSIDNKMSIFLTNFIQ